MSDDYVNPAAGIDAALDSAFAAIETVRGDVEDDEGGRFAPAELATSGIWDLAKKELADRKAERLAKEKADKAEKGKSKKADQSDGIDAALDKASARSKDAQAKRGEERQKERTGEKPAPLSTKDFNSKEVRRHREELRTRYPNEKLSEVIARFEGWERSFKKDPVATREAMMNAYLKMSPQNFQKAKDGKDTKGGKDLNGVLDVAFSEASKGDYDDLKPFIEKWGDKVPHLLKQLNEIDRDMIDDPVGTSARLAANYGAADAPKEAAQPHQLPPPASPEEEYSRVNEGLDLAIKTNVLPGLKDDAIQEAVAMVLSAGLVPRTANRFADLKAAYNIVVPPGNQAPAAPAERSSNAGSKSISGAPSTSTGRGKRGGDGLDGAINRAYGRV